MARPLEYLGLSATDAAFVDETVRQTLELRAKERQDLADRIIATLGKALKS